MKMSRGTDLALHNVIDYTISVHRRINQLVVVQAPCGGYLNGRIM